jgi:hypothetical protein
MAKTDIPYYENFDKKANELADKVIKAAKSGDRVAHWKAVYALLRHTNKKARKEQDQIAKEAREVREAKVVKKDKSKIMGLRWGVAMPQMTWNALVEADRLAYGRSDLKEYNKEADLSIKGSNQIVKDLEAAFPQFKVS